MTVPSGLGQAGAPVSRSRSYAAAGSTGLVKNDPTEYVSGSSGSSTMPLPARSFHTAARTSSSGARSPTATPSARASSGYRIGAESRSTDRRSVRSTTIHLSECLNTLVRYPKPQSAGSYTSTRSRSRS